MAVLDRLPDVVFKTQVRHESISGDHPLPWQDLTTQDIFGGKKVALFALPTCSNNHWPPYEERYDEFCALGVDEVICLGVNDVSVMYNGASNRGLNPMAPGNLPVK